MAHKSSSEIPERTAVVLFGMYLTAVGIHAIAVGHIVYRNYLRGPVLAPVGIAIGIVLIIAGLTMRR